MTATDEQIRHADFITAIMDDDSDSLKVFRNPNMPPDRGHGQPRYRPVFLDDVCSIPSELFALRTRVRELRGSDGIYTREERKDALHSLYRADAPAFLAIYGKRLNLVPDRITSNIQAYRMIGDILGREHPDG